MRLPDASNVVRRGVTTPRRNLVFTSAGDRSNVHRWLKGQKNFDLWITYYGDVPGRYADIADVYNARRDSKFGNLKFIYDASPELLSAYEAILVADDDLVISGEQLSRLFEIREAMDLWLLQPAFNPIGKLSWDITRAQWDCSLRFTNFVEMTCPLFRRDKLDAFMAVFDPVLTGTGTDWWYMQSLGEGIDGKVAIIDAITCVNPTDGSKGGGRECDRLQTEAERQAAWEWARGRYGVERRPPYQFGKKLKRAPARWLSPMIHSPLDLYAWARMSAWSLKSRIVSHAREGAPTPGEDPPDKIEARS